MNKFVINFFVLICFLNSGLAEEKTSYVDKLFHVGQMNSHNKSFSLFFKTRDKAILARGEDYNYVTDFPQDLYIYNYKTKISSPLISYEWFPSQAKFLLEGYDYPVFPEDFAYYLLKDNNTLVMISAIKNIKKNFKFDIANKKLNSYPSNGKFDFIISSIAKNCGHSYLKENYKCSYYKPLISNNLIN
ncbi:hypothetical protein [Candidatus Pelagibacter sp. Uisw_136]|uniref:hypothetical protein n=1 Tax=Candidatus Pelagibacter sp. Uisw_136 TaxID=3230991 RepID=UPI0039E9FEF5